MVDLSNVPNPGEIDPSARVEVRLRMPYSDALGLVVQAACDGRISGINVGDDVDIEMIQLAVPPGETEPVAVERPSFTETFDTENGPVDVITRANFLSFAKYELLTSDKWNSSRSTRYTATRVSRALISALNMDEADYNYIVAGYSAESESHGYGIRADMFDEIMTRLKEGDLGVYPFGEGSWGFLERFAAAFREHREAARKAVDGKLVDLGATALATDRHELALFYGSPEQA